MCSFMPWRYDKFQSDKVPAGLKNNWKLFQQQVSSQTKCAWGRRASKARCVAAWNASGERVIAFCTAQRWRQNSAVKLHAHVRGLKLYGSCCFKIMHPPVNADLIKLHQQIATLRAASRSSSLCGRITLGELLSCVQERNNFSTSALANS